MRTKRLSHAGVKWMGVLFFMRVAMATALAATHPKPGAPIVIDGVSDNKLVIGQPHEAQLQFSAAQTAWPEGTRASATVLPNTALGIFEPIEWQVSQEALASDVWRFPLTLMPQMAGTHYLTIAVTMTLEGTSQLRTSEVKFHVFASVIEQADAARADQRNQKAASGLPSVAYEPPLEGDSVSPNIHITPAEEVQR